MFRMFSTIFLFLLLQFGSQTRELNAQVYAAEESLNKHLHGKAAGISFDSVVFGQQTHFEDKPFFTGAPILLMRGMVDEFGRVVMVPDWGHFFTITHYKPLAYRKSVPAILTMDRYAKELSVTDAQKQQVRDKVDDYLSKRRTIYLESSKPAEYDKGVKKLQQQFIGYEQDIFDANQLERAEQIALRFNVDQFGMLAMLTHSDFSDELEVTADQKKELLKTAEDLKAELAEEMNAIQKKYDKKLLALITEEQQRAAKRDLGEPIKGMVPDLRANLLKLDFNVPQP